LQLLPHNFPFPWSFERTRDVKYGFLFFQTGPPPSVSCRPPLEILMDDTVNAALPPWFLYMILYKLPDSRFFLTRLFFSPFGSGAFPATPQWLVLWSASHVFFSYPLFFLFVLHKANLPPLPVLRAECVCCITPLLPPLSLPRPAPPPFAHVIHFVLLHRVRIVSIVRCLALPFPFYLYPAPCLAPVLLIGSFLVGFTPLGTTL